MQSDPLLLLFDVRLAAETTERFALGRTSDDYEQDDMLRSACERQLEIIGEAMSRLRDRHPEVFDEVDDGHAIIPLRNRLIHGYDVIDSKIVWDVVTSKVPTLRQLVDRRMMDKR